MFGGLDPKKMQAMMKQMGIAQQEIDASKVIIEKTDGNKIIIEIAKIGMNKDFFIATFLLYFIKRTAKKNNRHVKKIEINNSWRLANSDIEANMHIRTAILIMRLGIFKSTAV